MRSDIEEDLDDFEGPITTLSFYSTSSKDTPLWKVAMMMLITLAGTAGFMGIIVLCARLTSNCH